MASDGLVGSLTPPFCSMRCAARDGSVGHDDQNADSIAGSHERVDARRLRHVNSGALPAAISPHVRITFAPQADSFAG
jgi:hypothetical protein